MTDTQKNLIDLIDSRNEIRGAIEARYAELHSNITEKHRTVLILENNELQKSLWKYEAEIAKLEEGVVYIRWDMNAESYSGRRTFLSVHKTLEGAIAAIPESTRKDAYKRDLYSNYVANYTYEAIEKIKLGD